MDVTPRTHTQRHPTISRLAAGKELPYRPVIHLRGIMIKSTLTTKAQTTIPKPVRAALHLQPGDEIAYEILDNGRVVLTKLAAPPGEDPFAAFTEWDGPADRKAYADL